MMTFNKSTRLKIAAAAGAVLAASLFAALVFNPSTQPAITVAPYAMNNTNLEISPTSGTKAYRPWYENGAWTGDLIEYAIAPSGARTTTADTVIGNYVNSELITYAADPDNNWTVRSRFAAREASNTDYWKESVNGRNIFTYVDTNDDGTGNTQGDFLWNNLSDTQKASLDPATLALGQNNSYDSEILNFVRGDRSSEKSQSGGTFRIRFGLMGDVVNGWPTYVGTPQEDFTIPGFLAFKIEQTITTPRDGRVFMGANDGMLHVFDEDDGSEVYAYIPSPLISKLGALRSIPYSHTYYVDAPPVSGSAQIGVSGTWKTILAGGLGAGGKMVYILDVTDPDPTIDKILYEVIHDDIGHVYGRSTIARLADGNWYVFVGSGFDSVNGVAKLVLISLNDGTVQVMNTGNTGALAAPALIDTNRDFVADFAFAGDSDGNMWKFDLGNLSSTPVKIYSAPAAGAQPITTRPAIGVNPNGGLMVLFGTGGVTSLADAQNTSDTQAVFGIWTNASSNTLVTQTLTESTAIFTKSDGSGGTVSITETVRTATNNAVDYVCAAGDLTCTEKLGWKINLPRAGERVIGPVQLRTGRVVFTTTNPTGVDTLADGSLDRDLDGDSWLMSIDYLAGSDNGEVVYNLGGDGELDDDDKITIGGVATAPVGLALGDGNLSQPTIARRGPGTAIMYINGLRLPLPQIPTTGPLLSGHIDVETDSPSTATPVNLFEGGLVAKNPVKEHSEGYMTRAANPPNSLFGGQGSDGLGRSVDGHVHDYDTIHGISYVDMFELEKRRGIGDLSAVPVSTSGGSCPVGSEEVFDPDTGGSLGCIKTVLPELNRAYDNYGAPEADPVVSPPDEAEIYEIDANNPLPPDEKFIVVIANGDLSPAANLQIGCKVWRSNNGSGFNEFLEYQDHITAELEAGTLVAEIRDPKYGQSIIHTLRSIAADDPSVSCPTDESIGSPNPTLRISFSNQAILSGGVHGTRGQCVLGLHDYQDKVCYSDEDLLTAAESVLTSAPLTVTTYTSCSGLPATPPTDYMREPRNNLHITKSMEGRNNKFRWRNGALVVQLLQVSNSNTAAFELQPEDDLPSGNKVGRFGGTYAKAFTKSGSNKNALLETDEGSIYNESGLLYEMTLFWHYSDLAENLRRAAPASIPCYGDASYNSALTQELGGLTLGEYNDLINGLTGEGGLISQFSDLLDALAAALASGNQDDINHALLELGQLLEAEPDLETYARYRDYAPGHVPEQHLLDIDKGLGGNDGGGGSSTSDGIPVDVEDRSTTETTLDFDSTAGRSSWIDLRP